MWFERMPVSLVNCVRLAIPIAAACFISSSSSAKTGTGFMSGRMLLALCNAQDPESQAKCAGYIVGTFDTLQKVMADQHRCFFLAPKDFEPDQIVVPLMSYLKDNTNELDNIATLSIVKAWSAEFPC